MYSKDPKENELIAEKIQALADKYEASGQSLVSYLEGLLHADYLTYWNYSRIDTLLTLQTPRTAIPDEMIFIIYHQITDLYFKAIIWEMEQVVSDNALSDETFLTKLGRVTRYLKHLVHSFDVMVDGMAPEQFLKFRMSLLPASGFQSAQYRQIEIFSTDLINLVEHEQRPRFNEQTSVAEMYGSIYWKRGATEMSTGKKTLTLTQFEEKYSDLLVNLAQRCKNNNLYAIFRNRFQDSPQKDSIKSELRNLDALLNIDWCLSHYKSAVRYLARAEKSVEATGGTNWQQYLPPRFQRIIFYPELWSDDEKEEWGKSWVVANVGYRLIK